MFLIGEIYGKIIIWILCVKSKNKVILMIILNRLLFINIDINLKCNDILFIK